MYIRYFNFYILITIYDNIFIMKKKKKYFFFLLYICLRLYFLD